ncbi:MAG TPA: DUF3443 family protein [Steroidobacteraceae bacterium]|nr:DUF3443 family protein [Steroidobacteraceae bacterium]
MNSLLSPTLRALAFGLCLAVMSCGGGNSIGGGSPSGGGGSVTPADNVVSVTVGAGPSGVNAINTLYTSVTVCVPGTSTCQTIDNIQVDTGSYGLRLLSQAVTLSLPVAPATGGGGLVECTEFVDGYSWGPVALVDLQISAESATSVPVQLIGDSRYPSVPTDCTSVNPNAENTVTSFGANGILGIGPFAQDCGSFCVDNIPEPVKYYSCSTSILCQGTFVPLAAQVQNPVTLFTTDKNGTIITMPSVASTGAASVTGSLIFGIDTESNNMSGSETVVPVSSATGDVTTVFQGQTLAESFVDSGSNGTFFNLPTNDTNPPLCPSSGNAPSTFYCPASPETLTAAFVLANNSTVNANFLVASANSVSNSVTAYPGLAGTNPASSSSFDWGLPFFYGRRVATAIEGAATSVGTGPYIAF